MIIIIDYSGMSNLFRDFFQNNRIFLSWKPKSKNRKISAAEISIYIQKQMSYGRFSCIIDKKTGFFHSAVCNPVSEKLYSLNI